MTPPASTRKHPRGSLEWWARWLKPAFAIVLVATPLVLILIGATMGPGASVCAEQREHQGLVTKNVQPVTLNIRKGQRTTIAFGRDFATKRLTVPLEVVDGGFLVERTNPLLRVVGEFNRNGEDDGAQLSPKRIHVNALGRGNLVRVRVCVERGTETSPIEGEVAQPPPDPGTYEGSVTFVDKRVEPFTLPLTIKIAYPRWPNVVVLLYGVILVGSFYVWALRRETTDEVVISVGGFREFFKWCSKWNGLFAVAGGSAGAITVFTATYLASPDWGVGATQILSLVGAMFTAFVTAASALAKKEAGPPKEDNSSGSGGTR